jgi:hypothetical protein
MAAVIAAQTLLISGRLKRCLTLSLFKQEKAIAVEVFLMKLIEGKHPWRSELDVSGKDCLRPIDQEERGLPCGFGGAGVDGPEDELEIVDVYTCVCSCRQCWASKCRGL